MSIKDKSKYSIFLVIFITILVFFLFHFGIIDNVLTFMASQVLTTLSNVTVLPSPLGEINDITVSDENPLLNTIVNTTINFGNYGESSGNFTLSYMISRNSNIILDENFSFVLDVDEETDKLFSFTVTQNGTYNIYAELWGMNDTLLFDTFLKEITTIGPSTTTTTIISSTPSGGSITGPAEVEKISHTWFEIEPEVKTHLEISEELISITQIDLTVNKEVKNVKMTVEKLDAKPLEITKEPLGKTYQYLKIDKKNLENDDIENVTIEFKINKTWIKENNVREEYIVLSKYTTQWVDLPTELVEENNDWIYYKSETNRFSIFVIYEKKWLEEIPMGKRKPIISIEFPKIISIYTDETKTFALIVKNDGNLRLNDIKPKILGIYPTWVSISPEFVIVLDPGEQIIFFIKFSIPEDVEEENHQLLILVDTGDQTSGVTNSILNIGKRQEYIKKTDYRNITFIIFLFILVILFIVFNIKEQLKFRKRKR